MTPEPASPYAWFAEDADAKVTAIAQRFYDLMEQTEPELLAVHRQEIPGKIPPVTRERFALFFIGWLGGPQDYTRLHGHPRLRMRHAHVAVTVALRDAWLRCMHQAIHELTAPGPMQDFVNHRVAEVADFLRNAD
ncbi:MAG: hypothetical protein RJA70_1129 [Pseudomonadota bacterium]